MEARKETAAEAKKVPAEKQPSEEFLEESGQENSSDESEALGQLEQFVITNTGYHPIGNAHEGQKGYDPFDPAAMCPPLSQNESAERENSRYPE